MNSSYDIRIATIDDAYQIISLLISSFNGWPHFDLKCRPLEHWKWKFMDSPIKISLNMVAVYEGNIVGCTHSFPKKTKIGDKILIESFGADLAVDVNHRGKRLSYKMSEVKYTLPDIHKVNFTTSVSNAPQVISMNIKQGRSLFPKKIIQYIRFKDIDAHLVKNKADNRLIKKIGYLTLSNMNKIKSLFSQQYDKIHDYKILPIKYFDDRIDVFWNKIRNKYNFITERNKDYLNWRYCDKRGGNHEVFVAEDEDDSILGYLVLRIDKDRYELPQGVIVDLITLNSRKDIISNFLSFAVDYFDENNVNRSSIWCIEENLIEPFLLMNGYINSRYGITSYFRLLNVGDEWGTFMNSHSNQIHYHVGDTDLTS